MRPAILVLVLLVAARPVSATFLGPQRPQSPSALCREAIAAAERASGVPDRLMQAIGIVESGRPDERGGTTAWPWTINVEGAGFVFDTKEQAIAAVSAHRARGARSIDVGCMQINLLHHADAFSSIEEAFDPVANAHYAAQFLQRLLQQTGSWRSATAGYHSLTPDIGAEYARKVMAVWGRPNLGHETASSLRPMPPPSLPPASSIRIIPLPSIGAAPVTMGAAPAGRGLAAYRATPTRLATSIISRRG